MNIPFAQFRFNGETLQLTKEQFEQAIRDSRLCKCNRCLCCRAAEYAKENRYQGGADNSEKWDDTESIRRNMLESGQPHHNLALAEERWDSDGLREHFEVIGFLAPFVAAIRKSDGRKGSLEFTHNPRWYFNFVPDES